MRKSASIAAIHIMAMKTQQAALLLPKVPPFATNWMLCFLGDKGSLPQKVTQQSSHTASPEIRAVFGACGTLGKNSHKEKEKIVEYKLSHIL